jgi:Ca2+:H+ antiporter
VEESLRAAAQARSAAPVQKPPRAGRSWLGLLVRSALIACVPLSWYLAWAHAAPGLVFAVACLGVLPLAGWMGEATEHLAARTGPTVGGLLNATFGNAAELIIAVAALRQGLVDLVKASITGSILGNLLLILGLSFVAAGTRAPTFRFNRTAAGMSAGMLALAVIGLVFPALFHALHPDAGRVEELRLSEIVAVVLLVTYLASLLFSLKTHSRVFGGEPHPTSGKVWTVPAAVGVLLLATAATAVQAEILVHATEAVTAGSGLSQIFLGLIIIPLIGNAAEHATAVVVARKGQTDLALQIALGSSTQVALLIAPLLVFIGLFLGQGMNLVFTPFEVIALAMSTVVAAIITLDGESHWFEGVQLLAVYALVAAGALFI